MDYASYLVRIWKKEGAPESGDWQAEVESVQTGERRQFADLSTALLYLKSTTTSNAIPEHDERKPGGD